MPRSAKRKAAAAAKVKKPNPGAFKKNDPRINRAGTKVKGFFTLRQLAQQISEEPSTVDSKKTVMEQLLRDLVVSQDPKAKVKFLEIGWGKVEDRIVTSQVDLDAILERVDLEKLTNEQIDMLTSGKNIVEVLLADYLK